MRVQVLGGYGGESVECRMTCLLINGGIALDAGSLSQALPIERQRDPLFPVGMREVQVNRRPCRLLGAVPALASQVIQGIRPQIATAARAGVQRQTGPAVAIHRADRRVLRRRRSRRGPGA